MHPHTMNMVHMITYQDPLALLLFHTMTHMKTSLLHLIVRDHYNLLIPN